MIRTWWMLVAALFVLVPSGVFGQGWSRNTLKIGQFTTYSWSTVEDSYALDARACARVLVGWQRNVLATGNLVSEGNLRSCNSSTEAISSCENVLAFSASEDLDGETLDPKRPGWFRVDVTEAPTGGAKPEVNVYCLPSLASGGAGGGATSASMLQLRELSVFPKEGWGTDRLLAPWSSLPLVNNVIIDADNNDDDTLTITAHGMKTGDGPFTVTLKTGSNQSGLSGSANYYVNVIDVNTVQLYMDYATAMLGVVSTIDTDGELVAGTNAIEGVTSDTCTHDGTTPCTDQTTCSAAQPATANTPVSLCYMAPQRITLGAGTGDVLNIKVYPTNLGQTRGANQNLGGTGRPGSCGTYMTADCPWGEGYAQGVGSDITSFGTLAYAGGADGYHNGDIACGLQGLYCRAAMTIYHAAEDMAWIHFLDCGADTSTALPVGNPTNDMVIAFCGTTP